MDPSFTRKTRTERAGNALFSMAVEVLNYREAYLHM